MYYSIRKNLIAFAGIALATSAFADANPDNDIIIDQGILAAPKVAIANFNYDPNIKLQYRLEDIIANDLTYSGHFEPVKPSAFPQGMDEVIDPSLWVRQGINYLVRGEVTPANVNGQPGFTLHYKLFDLTGAACPVGQACIDKNISLPARNERALAHNASNEVYTFYYHQPADFLSKIAYVRQPIVGVEQYELYVSDYDGYNSTKIFQSNQPITSPAWSPDNSRLAFTNFTIFSSVIREYNFQTGRYTTLVNKLGNNSSPAYSPDGRFLAYSYTNKGVADIYLKSLSSGNEINITHGRGRNTEPTWYGNTLVFTSDRSGTAAIYQSTLNGSDISRVSKTSGQTTNAEVASKVHLMLMINNDRITTQNLKTGEVKYISNTFLDESVTLSPNGTMAIYSSTSGTKKILNLLTTDGLFRANLPFNSGNLYYPSWSN